MKKQTIIISGSIMVVLMVVLVVAQTGTMPTYIPDNINLSLNLATTGRITNQTFGNCLIGDTVRLKLIGEYNAVNNTFDYTTGANFGQCVQGMGRRSIDLTGITTQTQFLTALRNDIVTKFNQMFSARTTLNTRRIITGS